MKFRWLKKGEIGTATLGALFISAFILKAGHDLFGEGAGEFMKQLFLKPFEVGTLAPCSKYTAYEITASIREQNKNEPINILEVGPGNGTFTDKIVFYAGQEYHIDVVEINEALCELLLERFGDNDHVHIHRADILEWQPKRKYDIIISALPFNVFSKEAINSILQKYKAILKPGGSISYIELRGIELRKFFSTRNQIDILQEKLNIIAQFRKQYLEKTVTVFANVPPIYVHHLRI